MPTPAQIGAATAAVGGGALGGYFLANGLSSTARKTEDKRDSSLPEAETFDPSKPFESNSPYYQKLLDLTHQDHLNFLVKPTEIKNKEWWDWAYTNKFTKRNTAINLDDVFSQVDSGFSDKPIEGATSKQKALNQACDAAYKKEKVDYKFKDSTLLKNISDFCNKKKETSDISEPKFIPYVAGDVISEEYEVGVLSVPTNKTKLVKNDANNELWWNWAFSKRLNDKNGLDTLFSSVTDGYKNDTNTKTLSKACDEAYQKDKSELEKLNSKLLNEIKKLCSYNPEKSLDLPAEDKEPQNPVTINSDTSRTSAYSNGVGKVDDNKDNLIKPVDANNKKWWWWAFRNRYLKKASTFSLHTDFENLSKGYADTGTNSLNQKCHLAYNKPKTELDKETNKLLNNIKEFCTKNKETAVSTTNL